MTAIFAAAPFHKFADSLAQKKIDIDSDTLKAMLLSAYTPSASGHQYVSDVLSRTRVWAASTAMALNDLVNAGNGHYYKVTTAGTSAGSQPTWPTGSGSTVTDGTVTWTEQGAPAGTETTGTGYTAGGVTLTSVTWVLTSGVWRLKATIPAWNATGGSLSAKYVVFYDATPGTDATNPVICYWDLANNTTVTATNDNFTLTQDSTDGIVKISL